jgi:soluble lytic murein transglycosylase
LQEAGDPAGAVQALDAALQAGPSSLYAELARKRWLAVDARSYRGAAAELFAEVARAQAAGDRSLARQLLHDYLERFPDGKDRARALAVLRREYALSEPHREILELAPLPPLPPNSSAARYPEFQALTYLGMEAEAARALYDSLVADPGDPQVWLSLAGAALAGELPNLAWRAGERLRRLAPRDYAPDLLPDPIPAARLPLPYAETLEREAAAAGVDPLLVAAVIRQESRYDPRAKSTAAARGLMQLIPSTAAEVARNIGLELTGPEDLYVARNSIALGCRYLKELLERFGGDAFRAVAAYNTGAARVALWSRKCRSSAPDELLAEIYLGQPKSYVQEVMAAFSAYRRLYRSQSLSGGAETGSGRP